MTATQEFQGARKLGGLTPCRSPIAKNRNALVTRMSISYPECRAKCGPENIQSDKHDSRFKTIFHLSNKVDDVTPPAYLAMEENTVDQPNENQLHAFSERRYLQSDSDVTLAEILAWIDQPNILATVDSLLDYKAKTRAGRQKSGRYQSVGRGAADRVVP